VDRRSGRPGRPGNLESPRTGQHRRLFSALGRSPRTGASASIPCGCQLQERSNTTERRQIPKLTVGVLGGNPSGAATKLRRDDRPTVKRTARDEHQVGPWIAPLFARGADGYQYCGCETRRLQRAWSRRPKAAAARCGEPRDCGGVFPVAAT
jgi:hypothetical protein